ncbi:MAG: TraX family protein [Ruminococcus sp.]
MSERKFLNRDEIKYNAMFTMLLNHIANIFLAPGTVLCTLFLDIGYFTAPVMCYFLVEGYHYTRSRKKYALRLAAFAVISEIPFCLAFSQAYNEEPIISFCGFNMIFTLLLCFGILHVQNQVKGNFKKVLLMAILFLLSLFSDWAVLAPLLTLLFAAAAGNREKIRNAFIIVSAVFALLNFQPGVSGRGIGIDIVYALFSAVGIVLAGVVILFCYNGKRMERGRTFSKWFFYLFYPAHLLMLGILRIGLHL